MRYVKVLIVPLLLLIAVFIYGCNKTENTIRTNLEKSSIDNTEDGHISEAFTSEVEKSTTESEESEEESEEDALKGSLSDLEERTSESEERTLESESNDSLADEGVQGQENNSGYGYGETTDFPAKTLWISEDGYGTAQLYLKENGEACLRWEFEDGTICPMSDCFWTLRNDYFELKSDDIMIEGSMSLENLELRYEDKAVLLIHKSDDGDGEQLYDGMVGNWSLVSVDADGWRFDPNSEGIYSWLTIYSNHTVDYHWQDSNGTVSDEKELKMEFKQGAMYEDCGNEFWHVKLNGFSDPDTEYYMTLVDGRLLFMEYYPNPEGRETPMVNISEYSPYSP